MHPEQPSKPVEGKEYVLFGRLLKVLKVGEEQCHIKWDDGRETFIPNSWLEEDKT